MLLYMIYLFMWERRTRLNRAESSRLQSLSPPGCAGGARLSPGTEDQALGMVWVPSAAPRGLGTAASSLLLGHWV